MKIKIAVVDACIFIDLYDLSLVTSFFKLEFEIHTPRQSMSVYFELYPEQQQVLNAYQSVDRLIIHNLKEEDFLRINSERYSKSLSVADKSVIHVANNLMPAY